MKNKIAILLLVAVFFWQTGCEKKPEVKQSSVPPASANVQDHGTTANRQQSSVIPLISSESRSGTVITTMNSGGYSYVEIDENGEKLWVAVPETSVKVGDHINFPNGSMMDQFQSKGLNRTFEKILFVSRISTAGGGTTTPGKVSPHYKPDKSETKVELLQENRNQFGITKAKVVASPKPGSIAKVDGGYTVEELFSKINELKGKEVKVRGKVIKITSNVMGKNWVHIQDGTGTKGSNDITFTSETKTAQLGTIVLAEGTLAADKDFGGGYLYPAIVENSTFSE